MLHEFIAGNREAIVARTRQTVRHHQGPSLAGGDLEDGVRQFLTQLAETLRLAAPFPGHAIAATAVRHGADLHRSGCSVSQVVHDYGNICQAITSLAAEREASMTVGEFRTLNRCLDTAIAEAVTEHARVTAQERSTAELEHLGDAAHELRDSLNTALLSFEALSRTTIAFSGRAGLILSRSLMSLREVIDRTMSEVRLAAGKQRRARLSVTTFIDEIGAAGMLHAEYRQLQFTVNSVDPALFVDADPQLLASAVMNLLHNAFKNTPSGGHVVLTARAENQRLFVEIEDQCGGIPQRTSDLFRPFGERRGHDRSGLGLGLSIARKAVRAHGGEIVIRNMPGQGCVFIIEVPLAPHDASAPPLLG